MPGEDFLEYKGYRIARDRRYTETHEWVMLVGENRVRVGISDYAQKKLKSIVFVELPEVSSEVREGEAIASIESVKAIGEVYAPVSGHIVARNEVLEEDPGLINRDPYGRGWIAEIEAEGPVSLDKLLTAEEYVERVLKKEA